MRTIMLPCMLILSGCVAAEMPIVFDSDSSSSAPSISSSISSKSIAQSIEQVPSKLSVEHFANMKLVGSDFTIVDTLDTNGAYTRYQISYRSNGLLISGIMNVPIGDGPFLLLILNHGYIDPDVYTLGRGLKREQDYLARQGFVVIHPDYRNHAFSDESPDGDDFDASIGYAMDSANAINAVKAAGLPYVDTTRVGMLGHSMGGGVTQLILVAHPELIDAAVLYAPVNSDFWKNFDRWASKRDGGDDTKEKYGTNETNPEFWKNISPQSYFANIDDPILLFQGSNDKDVPKEWSDDLAERLRSAQKNIEYVEYDGEGHEYGPMWSDFMKRTSVFFKEHLVNEN